KSRAKPNDKLLEKVRRKQKEHETYSLRNITDVIGFRFVALFRAEMPKIVAKVVALISHQDGLSPNPFIKQKIEEIIIFSPNPSNDSVVVEVQKVLASFGALGEIVKVKPSKGYSSIHIVARIVKEVPELANAGSPYHIPVEVQIRTVFEDAWGEIDHKYGYVIRTDKSTNSPVNNPDSVQAHLEILKKFSDACAEYADVIHREATAHVGGTTVVKGDVIPVSSEHEILGYLLNQGLEE